MKRKSSVSKVASPAASQPLVPGTLYICATPIGNLSDISARALDILRNVHFIAAEDTRVTHKLLSHYQITKPMISYHDFNKFKAGSTILEKLGQGQDVALVSDAGTPGISDPGYHVITEALTRNIKVIPIPGASALTTALCASGLPTDSFVFDGFLPQKESELVNYLTGIAHEKRTLIWYESPHRLNRTLTHLNGLLGDRKICIARELTKIYEEFYRGTISSAVAHFGKLVPQGEFVLMVEGNKTEKPADMEAITSLLNDLLKAGLSKKDIARIVSKNYPVTRNTVYAALLSMKD